MNPEETLKTFLKWKLVVEYPHLIIVKETDLPQYKILTDEMKVAWMRGKLWFKNKKVTELSFEQLLYEISRAPVEEPIRNSAVSTDATKQGKKILATMPKAEDPRAKFRQMAADAKAFRRMAKSSRKAAREANPAYYNRLQNNLQQNQANYCRHS